MIKSYWYWTFYSMVFYTIGEWSSRKWLQHPVNRWYIVICLVGYAINSICWLPALKLQGSLSNIGTIYAILYLTITIFLGALVFNESISIKQWVGIGFAMLSILMLELK